MVWPFTKKPDLLLECFGPTAPRVPIAVETPAVEATTYTDVPNVTRYANWAGEKFPGGIGTVDLLTIDYWTLRRISAEMWQRNLYSRGIIGRLVDNIVNTGLHLEAVPDETVLGVPEDSLEDWSEMVEKRFEIWSADPRLCDKTESKSFGEIQAMVMLEALVVGDVLCMFDVDQRTRLPRIRLINGSAVQTPLNRVMDRPGQNRVRHGVELDANGRQVAYFVVQDDGSFKRIPAYGPKSQRRIAWLVYGTDKRLDDVRGEPLLSIVIQSLKEIDRYRDSALRKSIIASIVAVAIEREQPSKPSGALTAIAGAPALRKGTSTTLDTQGSEITYNSMEMVPGVVLGGLAHGEKVKPIGSQGTDEKFGEFEAAIIQAVAWCFGIPPEILRLAFSHNYSASQAANNEFALFLKKRRDTFARQFCQPVYIEWIIAEVTSGKIPAARLLESRRVAADYDVFGAWTLTDWAGQIKPAADMLKVVKAYEIMIQMGVITRSRASRELTGMKFSRLVKLLAKENAALNEAQKMLVSVAPPSPPANDAGKSEEYDGNGNPDTEDNDDEGDEENARALAVVNG